MFISAFFVKARSSQNYISKIKSAGNQRRYKTSLVGTSETIRATTHENKHSKSFYQWLAGIIDGDGCLLINKKGYTSLEISVGIKDLYLIRYIQNKIGGKVKIRSGIKSYRYRLHDKKGIENLINNINGLIQQENRKKQLHNVCTVINIPTIESEKLTNKSN